MMKVRRGVNLTGARQSGKTTLAEMLDLPCARRYTFDDKLVLGVAESDPNGFVRHANGESIVIDEVQKVPDILDSIKMVVDKDNSPGQYLLTGSANLRFAKAVKDSLAGRLGRVRLRTLALGELNGRPPDFLHRAFAGDFDAFYGDFSRRDVIQSMRLFAAATRKSNPTRLKPGASGLMYPYLIGLGHRFGRHR